MAWILRSEIGDQRLEGIGFRDREGRGKHKNAGWHSRPVGIVATGHGALCHAGHLVAAVYGMLGISGRLRVVMPVNWTLGA